MGRVPIGAVFDRNDRKTLSANALARRRRRRQRRATSHREPGARTADAALACGHQCPGYGYFRFLGFWGHQIQNHKPPNFLWEGVSDDSHINAPGIGILSFPGLGQQSKTKNHLNLPGRVEGRGDCQRGRLPHRESSLPTPLQSRNPLFVSIILLSSAQV